MLCSYEEEVLKSMKILINTTRRNATLANKTVILREENVKSLLESGYLGIYGVCFTSIQTVPSYFIKMQSILQFLESDLKFKFGQMQRRSNNPLNMRVTSVISLACVTMGYNITIHLCFLMFEYWFYLLHCEYKLELTNANKLPSLFS